MTFNKLSSFLLVLIVCTSCSKRKNCPDLINKGVDLVAEKKFDEAIDRYSEAIKCNSKVQLAYYNRATAYLEIRNYSKALADLNKIIELQTSVVYMIDSDFNPTDEGIGQVEYRDVVYLRAVVKANMDSLQSSFSDFQNAILNTYSDSSNCFLWQGTLLGRAGQNQKACQYFEKAKKSARTVGGKDEAVKMIRTHCQQTYNSY